MDTVAMDDDNPAWTGEPASDNATTTDTKEAE
jgi:hypothetical protein